MSDTTPGAFRRLVLDLYHGAADADTLRAAAEFARLLDVDLHCLFIQDEALMALATLPFAREIRLPTHEWSPLRPDRIEAELRDAADRSKRPMDEIVGGTGVIGNFEVLWGDPAVCIGAVCQATDIVVVTESPHLARGAARLRQAAHESAAAVLLLPSRLKTRRGPVAAIVAGQDHPSLDVACRIAVAVEDAVDVMVVPDAIGLAEAIRQRTRTLGLSDGRVRVHSVRQEGADAMLRAMTGLQERLIVMSRGSSVGDPVGAS